MTFLIIAIVVYLVSTFLMWKYYSIAYSENGVWQGIKPDVSDIFITFCPVMNTLASLMTWSTEFPRKKSKKEKKPRDLKKFFAVKDEEIITTEISEIRDKKLDKLLKHKWWKIL